MKKQDRVQFRGNATHLEILNESILRHSNRSWNRWRAKHPRTRPDLRGATLSGRVLRGLDLSRARLDGARLRRADLSGANLEHAVLAGADLSFANLSWARAAHANFNGARVRNATLQRGRFTDSFCLEGTDFHHANLQRADFSRARMIEADFSEADLTDVCFDGAKLLRASFEFAVLAGTSFLGANLREADVHGAFIRRVETDDKTDQRSLFVDVDVVWERRSGSILEFAEADSIRLAQFHDIVEEHGSIANLITACSKRVVLILGRFLPRRKRVLERLAEALRARGKIAVIFDFPGPADREISDTVRFIAGMSQFIVVDMTKASSVPLELQATIPDLMVPVLPIVQAGDTIFSMFSDLQKRYFWIQSPVSYKNADELVRYVDEAIILRAERAANALRKRRETSVLPPVSVTRLGRDKHKLASGSRMSPR